VSHLYNFGNVYLDDGEIEISFMENKKDKFQWPRHGDVLWIPSKDVLSIVAEPFLGNGVTSV
jgi:hypothetical protein